MGEFISYLIPCSFCMATFYTAYHFLFRKSTFHQWNRFYLRYTPLLSLFLPLLQFPFKQRLLEGAPNFATEYLLPLHTGSHQVQDLVSAPMAVQAPFFQMTWTQILFVVYISVACIMFIRLIVRLKSVVDKIEESEEATIENTNVLIHPRVPVSSFFHYIFWNRGYDDDKLRWILAHEKVHAGQWHSLDLITMELLVIFQWFNPLIYLFRRELQLIHEYIADRYVIKHQADISSYSTFLIDSQESARQLPFGLSIHSHLEERFKMMMRKKTGNGQLLKYALTVPVIIGLVVICASPLASDTPFINKAVMKLDRFGSKHVIQLVQNNLRESTRSAPSKERILFKWGEIEVPLEGNFAQSGVNEAKKQILSFSDHTYINIDQILKSAGRKVELIPSSAVDLNIPDPYAMAVYLFEPHNGMSWSSKGRFKLTDEFIGRLIKTRDGSRLTFHAGGEYFLINLTIEIEDFETKNTYIQAGNQKLAVTTRPSLRIQVRTVKQLLEILNNHKYIVMGDQKIRVGRFEFSYLFEGPMTGHHDYWLQGKISELGYIPHPVIFSLTDGSGYQYYAAVDDEPRPVVEYDTWDQVAGDPIELYPIELKVNEPKLEFQWGPLWLQAGPTLSSFKAVTDYVMYDNRSFAGEATVKQCLRILNSTPWIAWENGETFDRLELLISHIDPMEVPEPVCGLTYDLKEGLISGKDCLESVKKSLKPGDFIYIKGISPVGYEGGISYYFRVVE